MNSNYNTVRLSFLLILFASGIFGCQKDTVETEEPDLWDKTAVMHLLHKTDWRVETIVKVTPAGAIDLAKDPTFKNKFFEERKELPLTMHDPNVVMYTSASLLPPDNKFRPNAETYSIFTKPIYFFGVTYAWSDSLNTLIMKSPGPSDPLNFMLPSGIAVLDKKSIVTYDSYQEEELSQIPSNLTFKVTKADTTYLCHLKPLWRYEADAAASTQATYKYVVFP